MISISPVKSKDARTRLRLFKLFIICAIVGVICLIISMQTKIAEMESMIDGQKVSDQKLRALAERSTALLAEAEKRRSEADEDNKTLLSLLDKSKAGYANQTTPPTEKARTAAILALFKNGVELTKNGRHGEALTVLLKSYDESSQVASLKGARLSAILISLAALAESYPPARTALIERQEEAKRLSLSDPRDLDALSDFAAINRVLKQDRVTIALLDSLPPDDPRRKTLAIAAYDALFAQRRYVDALDGRDEGMMNFIFDSSVARLAKTESPRREEMRDGAVTSAVGYIETLLGAGKNTQAVELARKLLAFDPLEATKQRLRKAAERAGHPTALNDVVTP